MTFEVVTYFTALRALKELSVDKKKKHKLYRNPPISQPTGSMADIKLPSTVNTGSGGHRL